MKLMTFNLKCDNKFMIRNSWKKRRQIVKEIIEKYDCDIVCVQECTDLMFDY